MNKLRYLPVILCLLLLLSLPSSVGLCFRGWLASARVWAHDQENVELEQLRVENMQLRRELIELRQALKLARTVPDSAIAARVVYRSPSSWSSSLWVDVGGGRVAINSPVVAGNALIGVVDHVAGHRARVRLITDSGLHPSVRAQRSDGQLLAKGELSGSSHPLWRSSGNLLQGTGFNYDFSDAHGVARDLRSTEPPLVRTGDLLVTTGMDGMFPAGLEVARVLTVAPLREGAYFYDLTARPIAPDMNELTHVFVLSPRT